ncbi:RadC family protein [Dehalogenimonas etheniformans]|uniref:DNA repair protein RadC n=1 Tax=Dehalogenimonas etheniformans TaxID=1536648 RepID=A0A2P5P6L1_9CHLR|nr:DNA repair protein RadC [Dehalogenimonas etheniformans]PPD57933.1 DNA repair protein RadC [Dehalogenimonas etheniformans]QNT75415.1 DNA repair protein RadC [Dehalogenimonas etheniformans]
MSDDTKSQVEGHRGRLRERFKKGGLPALADYEVVELLLTLGQPRSDCKPAAKEAIKRFKTLRGVLEASPEELLEVAGIGPNNCIAIRLIADAARELLKEKIVDGKTVTTPEQVKDYLNASMGGLKKEVFKVIYLDNQNRVIETIDMFHGTINASAVWVREVIEGALKRHAAAMIFVHNHPSGSITPSQQDRNITRDLVLASEAVGIRALDHIIVGGDKHFSLASEGLMDKYVAEFQGLRGKR